MSTKISKSVLNFRAGYACAVAELMRQHDAPEMAMGVLVVGVSDLRGVAYPDAVVLRPLMRKIRRRREEGLRLEREAGKGTT